MDILNEGSWLTLRYGPEPNICTRCTLKDTLQYRQLKSSQNLPHELVDLVCRNTTGNGSPGEGININRAGMFLETRRVGPRGS